VADVRAQLIVAAAAGLNAAAAINADLVAEDARTAVEAYRQRGRRSADRGRRRPGPHSTPAAAH
jgi:hypothetical protein